MTRSPFVLFKSFDTTTEEGRSRERTRRATLTTLLNGVSRGASLAVMLVATRVALPYLGSTRFGVWMAISSLTTVLLVFDLGIGNSMTSRVAAIAARSDWGALKRLIECGLAALSAVGIVAAIAFACLAGFGPIAWFYKGVTPDQLHEARQALVVFGVLFGLSMPLQAASRIFAGLQEGYISVTASAVMSVASIACLPVLPRLHAGLSSFIIVTYGFQLASGFLLLIGLYRRYSLSMPRLRNIRADELRDLLSSGGLFFLLQLAVVIGWDMDAPLVSALMGPGYVAQYTVTQQMFALVAGPLAVLNAPLWAAYADANARGDLSYLRSTLQRSVLGTLCLATVGAAVISVIFQPLAHFLTKGVVQPPQLFVILFGVWTVMSATGVAFAMYLNGLHILLPQVSSSIAFVVLALTLKVALIGAHGLNGVMAATLVSYLAAVVIPYLTVLRGVVLAPLRTVRAVESS